MDSSVAAPHQDRTDRPARTPSERGRYDLRRILLGSAPYLTAIVSALWVMRSLFSGNMLGDLGDARWTISLHEHWYRVWTGEEGFRDLLNYAPMKGTLGTSDGFLVQGQIYALARFLGFGLAGSWAIASTVYLIIGALGVAAVSTRLFRTTGARVAFVLLTCTSYSLAANVGMHIQLIGILVSSWVFLGIYDIVTGRAVGRGLALLAVVPPLLALSTWYALILLGFLLMMLGPLLALLTPTSVIRREFRLRVREISRCVRRPVGIALVVLALIGWAVVLWVYLPARGLFPDPLYIEVQLYSPQWSDFINATSGGGGLWNDLYQRLFGGPTVDETARGFTPLVALGFLLTLLVTLRHTVLGTGGPRGRSVAESGARSPEPAVAGHPATADDLRTDPAPTDTAPARAELDAVRYPGRVGMLAAGLAAFAVLALIMVDCRGLGLYGILWNYVPGMESIRTPFRVMDIVYGVAFFVMVRAWELWWERARVRHAATPERADRSRLVVVVGAVVLVAFLAEMYRPPVSYWRSDQVLPAGLAAQVGPAREKCDAVIVVQPSETGYNPIAGADAVMFAVVADLPTPQGYSRGNPIGYPETVGDGTPFVTWMRDKGFTGTICRVSDAGVEPFPAAS